MRVVETVGGKWRGGDGLDVVEMFFVEREVMVIAPSLIRVTTQCEYRTRF